MSSQPTVSSRRSAALTNARSTQLAIRLRSVDLSLVRVGAHYRHFVSVLIAHPSRPRWRAWPMLDYGEPFEPWPGPGRAKRWWCPGPNRITAGQARPPTRPQLVRLGRARRAAARGCFLRFNEASGRGAAPSEALVVHLHDRMTESVIEPKAPCAAVRTGSAQGTVEPGTGRRCTRRSGTCQRPVRLALSAEEIDYARAFSPRGSRPDDVELMMFAQSTPSTAVTNLQRRWTIDGQPRGDSLFDLSAPRTRRHRMERWCLPRQRRGAAGTRDAPPAPRRSADDAPRCTGLPTRSAHRVQGRDP